MMFYHLPLFHLLAGIYLIFTKVELLHDINKIMEATLEAVNSLAVTAKSILHIKINS